MPRFQTCSNSMRCWSTQGMDDSPLILYVPGMLPKPAPEQHREEVLRCLLAALRRQDETTAEALLDRSASFDLIGWTYDFYLEHRDPALDRSDIDAALAKGAPDEQDIAEAQGWKRRLLHMSYLLGDRLPFLVPKLANERVAVHLRDLRRYATNHNDIGEHVRRLVKRPLEAATAAGRPVLLLSHSMGSVICWDALWELSRRDQRKVTVSRWVTMGSPLGGNYLQQRLKGFNDQGPERFPDNIESWINLASVGELTAFDRRLKNDFAGMIEAGLISGIDDRELYSFYRADGMLAVHNEYGYLMHNVTAQVVSEWWRDVNS